jgi:hypothetical protein
VPSTKKARCFGAGQLVRDLRCAPRFSMLDTRFWILDGCDGSMVKIDNIDNIDNMAK